MRLTLFATFALALQADPQEEYKAKLALLGKDAASKHHSVGEYLAGVQMHDWAREQFYKAIDYDPDHAGARKRLGYKKGEAGWESDPTLKQEFGNRKKGEDAERIRKQYNDRIESAGKEIARKWAELGNFCESKKLAAEAEAAFKRALEYDATHPTARKKLGFEKDAKGGWVSKGERELRKEMRDGIAKASGGKAAAAEPTETEKALSQKHRKRETEHFLVESSHLSDDQLAVLLQHAEHAYAMYHKIFKADKLFGDRKMGHIYLANKAQHDRYVEAFHRGTPAQKDLALKSHGSIGMRTEGYQEQLSEPGLQDKTIHATAQVLSHTFVRADLPWIHEGVAYYFTRLMKDSAATYCVDLAGTGPGSTGKNYQDPTNWPFVCKVWVRDGKDPDINAILKCTNLAELDGAETVKAWSLVDFLLLEHRDRFLELCRTLDDKTTPEDAFKKSFTWTLSDLDQRWRAYVKSSY